MTKTHTSRQAELVRLVMNLDQAKADMRSLVI
jgi:hypothetical protein